MRGYGEDPTVEDLHFMVFQHKHSPIPTYLDTDTHKRLAEKVQLAVGSAYHLPSRIYPTTLRPPVLMTESGEPKTSVPFNARPHSSALYIPKKTSNLAPISPSRNAVSYRRATWYEAKCLEAACTDKLGSDSFSVL